MYVTGSGCPVNALLNSDNCITLSQPCVISVTIGNWTDWSIIQAVIEPAISKLEVIDSAQVITCVTC